MSKDVNLYSRISDLCKITGDTMYSLSKRSGVSESVLSRIKTNAQVKLSKKNLILLANYFCVNEEWLATGEGDKEAPGVVKDTLIHDEGLHLRFLQIAQTLFGDEDTSHLINDFHISMETMSTYTHIPQERIWEIVYDNCFPSYTEVKDLLKADQRIDANWLFLGVGTMFRSFVSQKESERILKLVDTITTLQETINAKNETIALLTERVRQLEGQVKK